MLYSEFIENTGCRENDHNYEVYKHLEILYMNCEVSKAQVYEYGRKLVDNSDTPEQVALKEQIRSEIAQVQEELKRYRAEAARYDEYYRADRTDKFWKNQRDFSKQCVRKARQQIARLKWVLE